MTEIEKQFFETFGIEARYKDYRTKNGKEYECKNPNNRNIRLCYPQISDRILLELICILGNNSYFSITDDDLPIDINGLKKTVLHSLTLQAKFDKNKVLKQQIQELFEEG